MNLTENFESVKKFAVDAAQTATQKAKILAAVAKANVSIYAEEDKIRKAEAQLGKLYYRDYAVGEEMDTAEYLPWCQKIDESKKAIAEAKKYGEVIVAASSKDKNYSYIPDCSDLDIPEDTDYVYICENETIHGVTWNKLPNTKGHVLVSDQSSMFLSKPCNVSDYGMIYAGVQKNVGPAGMVVVIIREDLIREDIDPKMPIYMSYKTHADNGSMYNTPNCWAIYCCGKVFKYLKSIGGLEEMHKRNIAKAKVIYDFLDSSKMFKGTVEPEFRSLMNIHFVTESAELDAEVVAATKAAGYDNLKGHKSVGGLRASVYNAMPIEGAQALVEFLKKFEAEHTK